MIYKKIIGFLLLFFISVQLSNASNPNKNLNTAKYASYLSPIEKEIIYEINLFRSNPAQYALNYIVPLKKYYHKKVVYYPGDQPIKTSEGIKALNECIRVLKKAQPLPLMHPNEVLSRAAKDHQKDQEKTGQTGHVGINGSNMRQRIERHGEWEKRIAENIAYGISSARQCLIFLLIDDGEQNRGHRANLLHPVYTKVGVSFGKHPIYETMCVMDFAGDMP